MHGYYRDECNIYLIYGMPEGIGKSSYAAKCMAEIKGRPTPMFHGTGDMKEWDADFEKVKPRILFYPKDVVKLCKFMTDHNKREEGFIWDDAGLWLNTMEWRDPFVIAFTKYLNIARTNWAGIILTTPVPEWVLTKVRSTEGLIFLKVSLPPGEEDYRAGTKVREARAYRRWVAPDRKKTGVRIIFKDVFDAMMPNEFYDWYKPIRDKYATEAVTQMFSALQKRKDLGWKVDEDESVMEGVKEHISKANDTSVDFDEALQSMED